MPVLPYDCELCIRCLVSFEGFGSMERALRRDIEGILTAILLFFESRLNFIVQNTGG